MKIYALRDRFLDYFLDPVTQATDQNALQAVSTHVSGEMSDAITQAPHHFELWRLARVEKDGHIVPDREFLADVNTLVRARREPTRPGAANAPRPATNRPGDIGAAPGHAGDGNRPEAVQNGLGEQKDKAPASHP